MLSAAAFRRSSVVEQLTVNQLAAGSNPAAGANFINGQGRRLRLSVLPPKPANSRPTYWRSRNSEIHPDRDRPVVDQRNNHLGSEHSSFHRNACRPHGVRQLVNKGFSLIGRCSGREPRPVAARDVRRERELADKQDCAADIAHRPVHFAAVVSKHPQINKFSCDRLNIAPCIAFHRASEHGQAVADFPCDFSDHLDARRSDSLDNQAHPPLSFAKPPAVPGESEHSRRTRCRFGMPA